MSMHQYVSEADQEDYYRLCVGAKDWKRKDLKKALDSIGTHHTSGDIAAMLEIGCGVADIVPHLPAGIRYTGLDPADYCVNEARNAFPQHRFTTGYAEKLPFVDDSFDLVFSAQTLQMFERPLKALHEMARVVRPGGYILLVAPNLETPWSTVVSTRHYSALQRVWLTVKRFGDLGLRFLGISRFRVVPETFVEAAGRFEKGDDDLKYITSAWEVLRLLKRQGFDRVMVRTTGNPVLKLIGPLRYHGGGMFLFLRKRT